MNAQGSRIVLSTFATSSEGVRVSEQLADIGYSNVVKLRGRDHLLELVRDSPNLVLLFLVTDLPRCQSAIIDLLPVSRKLPLIGLFPRNHSSWDQEVVDACHEIACWPCSNQELDYRIRKLTAHCQPMQELGHKLFVSMNILGNSPEFLQVMDKAQKISKCDAPVFIDGETGTGKELIARAIHYLGERKERPFIATNCGAVPDQLIENEFFGHQKGAYTDASEASDGIIAQAEGGTLFLDEIETLSPKGQVSLLRFLDNMTYRPLGGKRAKKADIRIIAATNESIPELIERGEFRKDLYYRINIMSILLPPLRNRTGDISLLADHFIRQCQIQYNQPEKVLGPETKDSLKFYAWPGNVRELQNVLHRGFLLAEGTQVEIDEIRTLTRERRDGRCDRRLRKVFCQPMVEVKDFLIRDFEKQYLSSALERANGNISKAARLAGKERRSFTRLMEKYQLDSAQYKPQ